MERLGTERLGMEELFDLRGRTAMVTAAGQGMGRGIACRLADAGANVVVSHKYPETAQAVAQEIRERGGRAIATLADVTDPAQVAASVAAGLAEFGAIDILVNTAGGIDPRTPFLEMTEETWMASIDRNLKGAYFLSQTVARDLIAKGLPGRIVNIASTAAYRPDAQLSVYNIAKVGVLAMTRSLSTELAPHAILVNTVVPGPIRTTKTAGFYDNPALAERIAARVPLGGPGEPDDIANAVLFCAAPASRFMTGGSIVIDGGFMWGNGL